MVHDDDSQPATKGDLRIVKEDLRVFATKEDFQHLSYKISTVNESVDRVLAVLVNMDKNITGKISNHERRITKLESKV